MSRSTTDLLISGTKTASSQSIDNEAASHSDNSNISIDWKTNNIITFLHRPI